MRVEADPAGGAAAGRRVELAGRSRRADPAGDPGADRHHRRDGARRADVRLGRREVAERLEGCVFVAHNARFDYGFLKHEFARLERPFTARAVHGAPVAPPVSGRAIAQSRRGDRAPRARDRRPPSRARRRARALALRAGALRDAAAPKASKRRSSGILQHPEPAAAAAARRARCVPEAPGVYLFYGDNPLPLYIGKSTNLRERVGAHFSGDWRARPTCACRPRSGASNSRRPRASSARCCAKPTLVKSLLPAHNRALRRKADAGVLTLRDDGAPAFVPAAAFEPRRSRRQLRSVLVTTRDARDARCAGARARAVLDAGSGSNGASARASRGS